MDTRFIAPEASATAPGCQVSEVTIAELVGELYEQAPPVERGHLLEHLLRPLGVLSVAVVANGIFSKIRFRSGWQELHVHPEDLRNVRGSDVVALVDYVQQAGVDALDRLAQALASSPLLATSAAAALVVAILVRRAQGGNQARAEHGRHDG